MSESQVRSILQSVAAGDLSPAEAATLLDAVSADDQAEPAAAAVPAAPAAPAAPATPAVPATPPAPPAPVAPAHPDETQEFRLPSGSGTDGRGQVVVNLSGPGAIDVVCAADVTEPYADGPNTVTVEQDGNGFTVSGEVGDDSVVMLPSDLDLTISAHGDGFSLVGLVGPISAELNCGDVTITGVFAKGESRIQANTGDIDLTFLTGSDVEVIANAPATLSADGLDHIGRGRWSLGEGTAKLQIDGRVGGINLRTG